MNKIVTLAIFSLGLAAAQTAPVNAGTHTITTTFGATVQPLCTMGDSETVAAGTSGAYNPNSKQSSYNSLTGSTVDYSVSLPGAGSSSSLVLRCQKGTNVQMQASSANGGFFKNTAGEGQLNYTFKAFLDKRTVQGVGGELYRPKFTIEIPAGQWNVPVNTQSMGYTDIITMTIEWN
ncbi:hypothetical protein F8S09_05575 [Deinococcus sp. SDU3-2]|uniref:Spore coat protein U domain-containing protein n=1 Tax=Deinococcus terrestris TaxID=2651870 RepID=A0A7X1NV06_9DEIO|nr:hypothetical protein [Deinococcus terrestris]MPY66168.1 hypothetical protein [Deinococcus terrestris]